MSNLSDKDKQYIWHPFTQHATESDAIVISRAKGACLYDEQGKEMLDMISSWWTCTHGHAHPELSKTLSEQAHKLEHVMFAGFSHAPAISLAEKLVQKLPGDLNRVFFSDNGSTAVEVALKLAFQYWYNKGEKQRTKYIAFEGAYHGDTFGAMSVGKKSHFFTPFEELMFDVDILPYPATWQNDTDVEAKEQASLNALRQTLTDNKDQIAGLIIEPLMQGAGGIRLCRPEFIRQLVDICRQNDVLVIFDEVAVGFGRLGTLFACEKISVQPDLICLSKGLTAGYLPMSVTVATDDIFNAFLSSDYKRAFTHGHSFTGNPLACAVALRSLELFDEDKTLDKIAQIEEAHKSQIEALSAHPLVKNVRAMGSCLAFNLNDEEPGYKSTNSEVLKDYFLAQGFNIRPMGQAIYLMPPYCITHEQLNRAYACIFEGLDMLQTRLAA